MLKAMGKTPKGPILFLGLSYENLRRMKEDDDPIVIDLVEDNLEGAVGVMIFAGVDETTMRDKLLEAAGNPPVSDAKERPF